MAAPTFVQEAETAFNTTTTPKTSAAITDQVNDILVSCGVAEDGQITSVTPTLTGETFTSQQNLGTSGSNCRADLRTAVIGSAGTSETVSVARSALSGWFGANELLFRSSDGVGNSAGAQVTSGSSAPNLSITTTQANSAIVLIVTDWLAGANPTGWTWRTVNGSGPTVQTTFFDSAHYAFAIAYYPDAGAAGAKSVGVTDSLRYTIVAIEIKGSASGTDLTVTPGTPNVSWAGSTPSRTSDISRTPGTPNVDWAGSTPAVVADITRTPGTPNVAWSGSTAPTTADITRTPGTPNVAWSGSTPAVTVDKSLTPGTPTVAWSGSTPSLVLQGEVTLTPGAATVAWSGSTPTITIVPDQAPEEPGEEDIGGHGAADFSTEEPRVDLTLRPGPATMFWNGSTPALLIAEPPRPEPARRVVPKPEPPRTEPEPEVQDLTLRPGTAVMGWQGSRAGIVRMIHAEVAEELEQQLREEEDVLALLAALSAE